jgi:glycosyltransferase involved in cell wall biosynthesis
MLRSTEALSRDFEIEVISRNLHSKTADSESVNVSRLKCFFNKGFLFYAEFNIRLLLLLMTKSYDIVVAVDYDTLPAAAIAKRLRRKTLVLDAHEYFEESVEIVNRKRVQGFWTWIGKFFVPSCDAAFTVSNTIADIYSEIHGLKFGTIRNLPPSINSESSVAPDESKIILYQGVLNQGRKLHELVGAAKYLPKGYQIWIVGDGDEGDSLKETKLKNMHFYSWVPPNELRELTNKASLGFNLLDSKSKSYYYSLANKFFDYMHAGVPSINNNFPEYVKINERYNCCFLTDVNDAKGLASFVEDCLADEAAFLEKAKNSRLAARDLSWEKESRKLVQIFKDLR